jgi:hypothetical protein
MRGTFFLAAALLLTGCMVRIPALHAPGQLPQVDKTSPLKVHLRSGELLVLTAWSESDSGLVGGGTLYSLDRSPIRTGQFLVPRDSIALLETARFSLSRSAPSITMMGIWTALWTALTVQCVMDPKSCFGSCPTFYPDGGDRDVPAAEGFSASIARVLEDRDIDALWDARARGRGRQFSIRMTNEALETHAVRSLRLLAAPRASGTRVLQGIDGAFYPASRFLPPITCSGAEGDCLAAVSELDGVERLSLSDSADLATRETVELEFPAAAGPHGLVLAARQSLVSTYLFYQTIAYLGSRAGDWLAALERSEPAQARRAMGLAQALGGIEVDLRTEDGTWVRVGAYEEAGPIATGIVILPLGERAGTDRVHLRLRLAKGAWRVNWLALASLGHPVTPVALEPDRVERGGQADSTALRRLLDPSGYLVTYPGDEYRIAFTLPGGLSDPELFLESRGYYYEWMRQEWLAEEDPAMAALMLLDPDRALRRLAPAFKRVEPRMERLFWESRFAR